MKIDKLSLTCYRATCFATLVLASAAFSFSQTLETPMDSPLGLLYPSKNVLTVNAGEDQSAEAGVDSVELHGKVVSASQPGSLFLFCWINTTENRIAAMVADGTEPSPIRDAQYKLLVLNQLNGEWGQDLMKVVVRDTTAPQIWLVGNPAMFVAGGTPWIDPGVGVYDNLDGATLPVAVTGQVNTTSVGTYTITYSVTDLHHNTASTSRTVTVFYSWTGFLSPVAMDGSSVFNIGKTIPLKFELTGGHATTTNLIARLHLAKVSNGIVGSELEAGALVDADSGNVFRCKDGSYSYNLGTKGLSPGTWQLRVDMGDGAMHSAIISLIN
jgi:hypothetical protein